MERTKLGTVARGDEGRDAVHVATVPAVASETLEPGEHVAMRDGKAFAAEESIGIVDPFLRKPVQAGQAFHLCLYPGSVINLRHSWSHPSLPQEDGAPNSSSEAWLRDYAAKVKPYDTPEQAYANLLRELSQGELYYRGRDLSCRDDVIDEDDLRRHAAAVGINLDFSSMSFTCSC